MAYQVRTEKRPATNGLDGTVYILEDPGTGDRAEIWPALGCNCYRWQVPCEGQRLDMLYSAPNLFDDIRPTRSGIPILFPFPNRIRAGCFHWYGKEYRLPLNDSSQKNAIHGFACRHPWRITGHGADDQGAWLSAEFWAAKDAPEVWPLWPADHRIRITFRLASRRLRLEAEIDNPGDTPLPFGLGFHPYFRVPLVPGGKEDQCRVEAQAGSFWELADSLPTGKQLPVDAPRNLTRPRPCSELQVDDVLHLPPVPQRAKEDALFPRGSLWQEPAGIELYMRTSPAFRELVVFTPQHRQAFCLEPYTCTTDAVNLESRGVDAGLQVLQPGTRWSGLVEMEIIRRGT